AFLPAWRLRPRRSRTARTPAHGERARGIKRLIDHLPPGSGAIDVEPDVRLGERFDRLLGDGLRGLLPQLLAVVFHETGDGIADRPFRHAGERVDLADCERGFNHP